MSRITFTKTGAVPDTDAVIVAEAVGTSVAVFAPAPPAPAPNSPLAFNDRDIGFSEIILPRLNIVQKVGNLSEVFSPGEIVLKQAFVIYTPPAKDGTGGTPPLNMTVVGFKKTQFAQKIAGGAMGILAHSEQEVVSHGGTLDYNEWKASEEAAKVTGGKPLTLFQRLATALVLVEKPAHIADEDHIEFPYECEGKYYALLLWSMKGTAYTHAAKVCFTARFRGHLREGYSMQSWSLSTLMEKFKDNYAAVPVIKPAAKNSEAFQAFVKDVLSCD